MKCAALIPILMLAVFAISAHASINPYDPGTLSTVHISILSDKLLPFRDLPVERVDLYLPTEGGSYPLNVFIGGLAGDVPVIAYSDVLNRTATQGIVTAGISTFALPLAERLSEKVEEVIAWLQTHLNTVIQEKYGLVTVDFSLGIGLMGHSAGGKVVAKFMEDRCSIVKVVGLLNPVDGSIPWNTTFWNSYVINPPYPVNVSVPTLVLGEGLGPVPGSKLSPACAPEGRNFPRFYNAWRCPKYELNATQFGHGDFLDPFFFDALKDLHFCAYNHNATSADFQTYRNFVAGTITAIMRGVLLGECDLLAYISQSTLVPSAVQVDVRNDVASCAGPGLCPKAACTQL